MVLTMIWWCDYNSRSVVQLTVSQYFCVEEVWLMCVWWTNDDDGHSAGTRPTLLLLLYRRPLSWFTCCFRCWLLLASPPFGGLYYFVQRMATRARGLLRRPAGDIAASAQPWWVSRHWILFGGVVPVIAPHALRRCRWYAAPPSVRRERLASSWGFARTRGRCCWCCGPNERPMRPSHTMSSGWADEAAHWEREHRSTCCPRTGRRHWAVTMTRTTTRTTRCCQLGCRDDGYCCCGGGQRLASWCCCTAGCCWTVGVGGRCRRLSWPPEVFGVVQSTGRCCCCWVSFVQRRCCRIDRTWRGC